MTSKSKNCLSYSLILSLAFSSGLAIVSGMVASPLIANKGLAETVNNKDNCDLIERRFARQSKTIFKALEQEPIQDIQLAALLQGNLIMLHGQSGCNAAALIDILREVELSARHSSSQSVQASIIIEPVHRPLVTTKPATVYMLPSANSEELGTLEKDSVIIPVGKVIDQPWYKINVAEDLDGFVPQNGLVPDKGKLGRRIANLEQKAKQGDIEAYYQLGNFVSRFNINEALAWWMMAAEQNHGGALYNIGVATLRGAFGKTPNKRDAIAWFQLAALKGHEKSKAFLETLLKQKQQQSLDPSIEG